MSKVRVCFLGTPAFAVTCLQALLNDEHYEVVGIITQPDRPAGRKLQLTPSPVKNIALTQDIPVYSPESLRKEKELWPEIQKWAAEVAVVVAYGQILDEEFMQIFPLGAVNVHGSLLPRWRGAAPIQRALEAGDSESGVCLQKMVKKLDAGDVIGARKVSLDHKINALELHDVLADLGAQLLRIELMDYVRGNLAAIPQDESQVTYAKKIEKEESLLDWKLQASKLHGKVRGFSLGPGTYFTLDGKRVKVHRSIVKDDDVVGTPGKVSKANEHELVIETSRGKLALLEVQPESKARMATKEFLAGHPLREGQILTP